MWIGGLHIHICGACRPGELLHMRLLARKGGAFNYHRLDRRIRLIVVSPRVFIGEGLAKTAVSDLTASLFGPWTERPLGQKHRQERRQQAACAVEPTPCRDQSHGQEASRGE